MVSILPLVNSRQKDGGYHFSSQGAMPLQAGELTNKRGSVPCAPSAPNRIFTFFSSYSAHKSRTAHIGCSLGRANREEVPHQRRTSAPRNFNVQTNISSLFDTKIFLAATRKADIYHIRADRGEVTKNFRLLHFPSAAIGSSAMPLPDPLQFLNLDAPHDQVGSIRNGRPPRCIQPQPSRPCRLQNVTHSKVLAR